MSPAHVFPASVGSLPLCLPHCNCSYAKRGLDILCTKCPSCSQPNMHAAERYEGVVDKLRECNEQLEGTKEAVRDLALRFEEVRKRRQQLFQVRDNYNLFVECACRSVRAANRWMPHFGICRSECSRGGALSFPLAPAQLLASSEPAASSSLFHINMLLIIPRTATRKCRRL
jgi:hypothetical protein